MGLRIMFFLVVGLTNRMLGAGGGVSQQKGNTFEGGYIGVRT